MRAVVQRRGFANFPIKENHMSLEIEIVPCLSDNYAYLVKSGGHCAVVDPSEPEPIRAALAKKGWALTHILNTHHHLDHCGGNLDLKQETGAIIVGLSLIHISEPTRQAEISYAVFCLKK